jgi:MscS family membrane protein
VLLVGALAQSAFAQIPGLQTPTPATSSPHVQVEDPLGRATPRGTIAAFMRAVDRDDFVSAARYMQVNESQRRNTEPLARDLKALMDRYFSQALTSISDSPTGALDDALPIDREHVGPLTIGEKKTDVTLVRVTDPQAGPIWLISSETLAQVPALRDSAGQSWIERVMPAPLVRGELFGLSLAHWVVLAASLVIPFVLLTLIAAAFIVLARRIVSDPARRRDLDAWYAGIRWPAIIALTLAIQLMSMPVLGIPLTFRMGYARVGLLLFVIALTWLIRRLLTLGFARARSLVWGKDRASTQSLMLLGERLVKALVVVVAIVAILLLVGVDSKTALAAFGIVGVALALGAQRTVENLLGGVFMLSDRAIAVGDLCSISNRLGWIEDITLRSVRVRTLENSLVSVPAGVLAQTGIENFATRHKILAQSILRLRHGTSVEQLKRILDGIRTLLEDSPRIETGTSRIRLVNFGAEAIELDLFAYVLTADVPEFLAVREELLLQIAAIVEAAGSGFAQPTQFIYMDETSGVDASIRASGARKDVRLAHSITGAPMQEQR